MSDLIDKGLSVKSQRSAAWSELLNLTRVMYAFARRDFIEAVNYPMAFVMTQVLALAPVAVYYFVSQLVPSLPGNENSDYFTFVVVGLAAFHILSGALQGFGGQLEVALQYGHLETYLVQPIRWRLLPYAMVQWRAFTGVVVGVMALFGGWALGADLDAKGLPIAFVILGLGMVASVAIGTVSASLLLLAKKSQTVLTLYLLAASLLSGVYFPLELLPNLLRPLSWLIPHTYVIGAVRHAVMAEAPQGLLPEHATIFALAGFNLLILPIGIWLFGKSLAQGRKFGMLGSY